MFDWRALQHRGLKELVFQLAAHVIFPELSRWERAKWTLIRGLLIILPLAVLATYINRREIDRDALVGHKLLAQGTHARHQSQSLEGG